jgi:imidazole glycerol-phosphate synthase subunit HisH
MIALIDYDSGNLRSAHRALLKVGADVRVVRDAAAVRDAHAVVLPGVGAFDDCVNALRKQELLGAVKEAIDVGKPFFGICVGYQALFDRSEEFNSCAAGLGVFGGSVVRFTERPGLKIPQIGWNRLKIERSECPMLKGVADGSFVYFVHSFYPQPTDLSVVATTTEYGDTFTSAVWRDNVFATQFHPEKSQDVGLKLLENFVEFAKKH